MNSLWLYILGALGMAVLPFIILKLRSTSPPRGEAMSATDSLLWSDEGLSVAERLLDSSDYLWLRDEVKFPDLAQLLLLERKRMVLAWLYSVHVAFKEIVRAPQPAPLPGASPSARSDWAQLFITLRFNLLLLYATGVVRLLGPYHRMIPSLHGLNVIPQNESVSDRHSMAGKVNS
jgi:hypothetical protein